MDIDGNVVGINTFIFTQSGGSEGIGFAVPSNIVRNVFEQIYDAVVLQVERSGLLRFIAIELE